MFAPVEAVSFVSAISKFPSVYRLWQFSFGRVWVHVMRQHQQIVIEKVDG